MHLERAGRARCACQRIYMWFESLLNKRRQFAELAVSGRGESNRIRHGSDSDFAFHLLPWNRTFLLSLLQRAPSVSEIALILSIDRTGRISVRHSLARAALWEMLSLTMTYCSSLFGHVSQPRHDYTRTRLSPHPPQHHDRNRKSNHDDRAADEHAADALRGARAEVTSRRCPHSHQQGPGP